MTTSGASLVAGADVELTVEKPAAGGRMLARHQGQIVFVAGAIPGERVRARIERVARQLAYAETRDVLEASRDRRASFVEGACGGSVYAHIEYPRQLSLKAELLVDAFARIGKIQLPAIPTVTGSREQGYRMRARLHVDGGRVGFYREGTHRLCDAAATQQLLPETLAVITEVQSVLHARGCGPMTAIDVSENMPATERAVLVELEAPYDVPTDLAPIAGISGLAYTDPHRTRVIVGYGSPYVTDRIGVDTPAVLMHHVQSFFQGNRHLLPTLVDRVLAHVPDGAVTDLYAGVGLFAAALAASGRTRIFAVEGDQSSARDLEANAAPFGAALTVAHLSVERYLQQRSIPRPDTLLLDPPRTGISRDAIEGVLRLAPPRIVYVSCDAATLARDVKRLIESGYRLTVVEAFDLFPNTAHVETVAVLLRN